MIARTVFFWVLMIVAVTVNGQKAGFERAQFYVAMASDNIEVIKAQQEIIQWATMSEKKGLEGALLMKKAGLAGSPIEKLSLFKEGHKLLEAGIKKDTGNVELRFLRLMIQERAPKIVNYRDNIAADSDFIKQHFNELMPEAKKALYNYSKTSKTLKPTDFNQA